MAAVIAGIVAAFFAGAIALYRERRIELTNLLVAARVMSGVFTAVAALLDIAAQREDVTARGATSMVRKVEGENAIARPWEEHRNVLAAHLSPAEWRLVVEALEHERLLAAKPEDDGPTGRDVILVLAVSHNLLAASRTLDRYGERSGWIRNPGRKTRTAPEQLAGEVGFEAVRAAWMRRRGGVAKDA